MIDSPAPINVLLYNWAILGLQETISSLPMSGLTADIFLLFYFLKNYLFTNAPFILNFFLTFFVAVFFFCFVSRGLHLASTTSDAWKLELTETQQKRTFFFLFLYLFQSRSVSEMLIPTATSNDSLLLGGTNHLDKNEKHFL